jgi:hypothetical protein
MATRLTAKNASLKGGNFIVFPKVSVAILGVLSRQQRKKPSLYVHIHVLHVEGRSIDLK